MSGSCISLWMTRQLSSGVLVVVIAMLAAPAARGEGPPPIQVMIVGTYHFGNPGHDLHNTNADDVTTPRRQKELAELATLLERFKPTRVAVEASISNGWFGAWVPEPLPPGWSVAGFNAGATQVANVPPP